MVTKPAKHASYISNRQMRGSTIYNKYLYLRPDIDIDICQVNRSKIIDYVRQKYGHVAQIITFGTMKARAVIRDICRVLGVPLSEADMLAKLVPDSLGMTLDRALNTEPKLKQAWGPASGSGFTSRQGLPADR